MTVMLAVYRRPVEDSDTIMTMMLAAYNRPVEEEKGNYFKVIMLMVMFSDRLPYRQ